MCALHIDLRHGRGKTCLFHHEVARSKGRNSNARTLLPGAQITRFEGRVSRDRQLTEAKPEENAGLVERGEIEMPATQNEAIPAAQRENHAPDPDRGAELPAAAGERLAQHR